MIERLFYINERGDQIELSALSRYHVNVSRDVGGLSDIKNKINSASAIGQDGDTFISDRIEARDIDIQGRIKSRDKAEQLALRRWLNHVLNPQYSAKLVYQHGNIRRVIGCKVESGPVFKTAPIFPQFNIQLFCMNPFWREEAETRNDIAVWDGGLEFELELDNDWEIGSRSPSLIVNVENEGDVTCGMVIRFRAMGEVANPMLLNLRTQEMIQLNYTMRPGDVLEISTGFQEKSVTLTSGGQTTDAFRYLDPDSTFLTLAVGENLFRYGAESNLDALDISIYHNRLYLGV